MEITVRHNRVYLKNVDLGETFSNMVSNLIVDKLGRVKVETGSKHSFYTDLDNLTLNVLQAIFEVLQEEENNNILKKIEERTKISIQIKSP